MHFFGFTHSETGLQQWRNVHLVGAEKLMMET
jgi:hypothetical protein